MEIRRGDTKSFRFQRKSNGQPITEIAEKIYFTVKKSSSRQEVLFQKTIDDMDFDENYFYHFTIYPEDTNNLKYDDNYKYDIEVKIGDNYVKTIALGQFELKEEVTFARNEV